MNHANREFERIHDLFRPRIQRYLARLVGAAEAEDLTQEVFVKVSQALGTFRGECELSSNYPPWTEPPNRVTPRNYLIPRPPDNLTIHLSNY